MDKVEKFCHKKGALMKWSCCMLRAKVMVLYMLGDIDLTEGFNLCPANKI
jgi:hypothetical protein